MNYGDDNCEYTTTCTNMIILLPIKKLLIYIAAKMKKSRYESNN